MRKVRHESDLRKIVWVHYMRLYGDHELAIEIMKEDLKRLEEEELYEQCSILKDTIKEYA